MDPHRPLGRLADRAEKRLIKGLPVLVHGEKRTRTFTDGNGTERTVVELVAEDFHLLARHQASQEQ